MAQDSELNKSRSTQKKNTNTYKTSLSNTNIIQEQLRNQEQEQEQIDMNIDYDEQETDHIFSSLIMCHTCNKPFETSEEASKCTHSAFETPTRIDQFQKSGIDKLKNKRLETMSDQRTTNKELLRIAKSHTSSVHSGGSNRSFTSMQVNELLQKQKQEMILLQNEKEKRERQTIT